MHPLGRSLLMLKQYLDMRLAGAPAWLRVAAELGLILACLALFVVGVLTGHYVLSGVGVLLAVLIAGQGVAVIRHRWRHAQAGPGTAGAMTDSPDQGTQIGESAGDRRSLRKGALN